MGLHEIAIGNIYISPILVYALITLPITYFMTKLIQKTDLQKWVGHDMLFTVSLYSIILFCIAMICSVF